MSASSSDPKYSLPDRLAMTAPEFVAKQLRSRSSRRERTGLRHSGVAIAIVMATLSGCGRSDSDRLAKNEQELAVRMPDAPGDSKSLDDAITPPDLFEIDNADPLQSTLSAASDAPDMPVASDDSLQLEPSQALSSRATYPDVTLPSLDDDDVGLPTAEPQLATKPTLEMPKLDSPAVERPDLDAPALSAPSLAAPQLDEAKIEAPPLAAPQLDAPKFSMPSQPSADVPAKAAAADASAVIELQPVAAPVDDKQNTATVERIAPPRGEPDPTPNALRATPETVPAPSGTPLRASFAPAAPIAAAVNSKADTMVDTPATGAIALLDSNNVEAKGPEDYRTWPIPDVALIVTGQQHGYIEPCGCTGLENQKGGVARRYTFMQQLRDEGWNLLPVDGGNQVRRFGRQADIKFQRTAEALTKMGYKAVGFGPDDLRLGVGELISVSAAESADQAIYLSSNVVLLDPSLMPAHKIIESGGMKIGITSALDPDSLSVKPSDEISVDPPAAAVTKTLEAIRAADASFALLLFFGEEEAAKKLAQQVPGYDMVVVAGGYGEPTYRPETIEGTKTQMIVTGNKGMYVGLVGLYADAPLRYARVPLTHEFKDAPEMRRLMAEYQNQLRDLGLEGLGLKPIPHPSGNEFVGSERCGECHTTAYQIWENTPHSHATKSLVNPGERSDVPRHFDPECLSCHVTGWNPQNYYPYTSGYLSLETHEHLTGNGCENCHGPGSMHVRAEEGDDEIDDAQRDALRLTMQLPLEKARERCMECHDLDNSPDFHEEGAFDDYWSQVEHIGKD